MDSLDYDELKIKFDTVCMQNEELVAALEAVEWVNMSMIGIVCPWCKRYKLERHAPNCQRQKALQIEVHDVR